MTKLTQKETRLLKFLTENLLQDDYAEVGEVMGEELSEKEIKNLIHKLQEMVRAV